MGLIWMKMMACSRAERFRDKEGQHEQDQCRDSDQK